MCEHELCVRIVGVLLEVIGVLALAWRIAKHREVWARLWRWFMRTILRRTQSVTIQVKAGSLTVTGGRAYLDQRPGEASDLKANVDALWRAVDTLRERINDSNKDHREAIAKANERITDESNARQAGARQTHEQVRRITRGDWFDGVSVVCILAGIFVANFSNEIACALATLP
jgi:hypothetical protein